MTVYEEDGKKQVAQLQKRDPRTGTHFLNGIMILRGNHITDAGEIPSASIEDLTPTILHLLGEAVPQQMDGQVLTNALTEIFLTNHPVRYHQTDEVEAGTVWDFEEQDAAEIEERLRGLGYL